MASKKFFDSNRRKRKQGLKVGTIVLLYNSRLDKQWSKKLDNRWMGSLLRYLCEGTSYPSNSWETPTRLKCKMRKPKMGLANPKKHI